MNPSIDPITPEPTETTEQVEKTKNCKVCHLPLDPFEVEHNHHFHVDCKKCHYCSNEVQVDIINRILKAEENPADGPKVIVYHQVCRDRQIEQDFKNTPVTITRSHLDYLTRAVNMASVDETLSVESNQLQGEIQSRQWISEMTLEQKYLHLKKMEAITAMLNLALSKDKQRILIMLSERDKSRMVETEEIRRNQATAKVKKQEKTREAARKVSPKEKTKEKAIVALMNAAGMTREQATAIIDPGGLGTIG